MEFERMLRYCAELELHNNRTWFHENHADYEAARADYLALLNHLRFLIAEEAPAIADDLLYTDAKSWMYRIARDMRYYKDRPPYIPRFRAYLSGDKKSWLPIGYFLIIGPGDNCFGTGIWSPDSAHLNRIRSYISENAEEFEALVKKGRLHITGEQLKTMPRGFSAEAPGAPWLRFKNWCVSEAFPDASLTSFEEFGKTVRKLVRRMEPMRQFLLDAARSEESQKEIFERFYSE